MTLFLISLLLLQSCKIADLSTSAISIASPDREEKAVALLDKVIETQRFDILSKAQVYSYNALDHWSGISNLTNPFPENNELMTMRFKVNSFDSQFEYVENRNSDVYGLQDMQYYTMDEEGSVQLKNSKKMDFALPAVQYIFELPLRLKDAQIIKYAGEETFEGEQYDLVFATWKSVEATKENDQYLLYISKDGYLRFASFTIRGTYLPAPKNIYSSVRYEDFKKNEDGIAYPSKLYFQLNEVKALKKTSRTMTLSDLKINSFEVSELYPIKK